MTDPVVDEHRGVPDVPEEVERALSSIWQRRTGARPRSITAEMRSNSIKCAIAPGEPDPEREPVDAADGTDSNRYRHEATSAVGKIARRNVIAYIAKRDAEENVDTQTFIFERLPVRY
jgi:hypothetical protein